MYFRENRFVVGTKLLPKNSLVPQISSVMPDKIGNCKAIQTKHCKYNIKCKCNNVVEHSYTPLTQNNNLQ